jgi:hypothetical protein
MYLADALMSQLEQGRRRPSNHNGPKRRCFLRDQEIRSKDRTRNGSHAHPALGEDNLGGFLEEERISRTAKTHQNC